LLGKEAIENRFGSHKATIEGDNATLPRHLFLRKLYKELANRLDEILEDGRLKNLTFDRLEEASMWSHKAIAENAPLTGE
jgi:hypothetical protein